MATDGGSPPTGVPANRAGAPARGWAARERTSTVPLDWAGRHGRSGGSTAAPPAPPAGAPTAQPIFAAHFGTSKQLTQPARSPLASATAAFSQLQFRIADAAASLLAPAGGRGPKSTATATALSSWPRSSGARFATARPFASLTSASSSSSSSSVSSPQFGSISSSAHPAAPAGGSAAAAAAAKADVGRATWTLLHTLAAQFPDRPTRQQQRDARTLVDCLTRIYPCGDCARHFAELVRRDPPVVSSGPAFRRWLCGMHNRVNARLGKPSFNCDLVESRWAPLGCSAVEEAAGEGGLGAANAGCDLLGVGAKGPQGRRG